MAGSQMLALAVFPFDTSVHVRDQSDKRLFRDVRYGVDFGWTNQSAIVVLAYDYDGRVWVQDEFYKTQCSAEDLIDALVKFFALYGRGEIWCDKSEPESIVKMQRASLPAQAYPHKREDGIRELGARFPKAGDGLPRLFISSRCINLISELLEYKVEVKERDHAVDALRYALKLKITAPLAAFRFG
jgi:hypothetical protein